MKCEIPLYYKSKVRAKVIITTNAAISYCYHGPFSEPSKQLAIS